ncbi:hypothetical protein TVAG_345550 [Trichomonas vaginalis G3]|uniref:Uncharacterized protein n=1 Tax=Trichomonas vaginalis (strain ATCC PRA-98 / G3) TaxID=412133 RepID=A2FVR7_TRIV3|nr:ribonuclease H protein family [Trichomonas vaginalis G3]EAX90995.1 hypothetical protein TVAG_345550 [Trichomonas vaginalis G3]KAI5510658.1 ribonuclease H protein family [Trichomonas vaginalis G3]|eukprot:XP_001303925.1 hypothetical protein [Trichomonas vaginalis G3]
MRETYYALDHFDIHVEVSDNTIAKLFYCLNELYDKQVELFSFVSNGETITKVLQIPLKFAFPSRGNNKLHLYAIDEFDAKSEEIVVEFNYNPSIFAPQVNYVFDSSKTLYAYHQTIDISGQYKSVMNSIVTFYYKINDTDYQEIKSYIGCDMFRDFSLNIPVPRSDAMFVVTIEARTKNGATSQFITHFLRVEKRPGIYMDTDIKFAQKKGDDITIKGYIGDFDPDQTFKVYYSLVPMESKKRLQEIEKVLVGELLVDDRLRSDSFSFNVSVPTTAEKKKMKIWAESNGESVASALNESNFLNILPTIELVGSVDKNYYPSSNIDLELNLKDDSSAKIMIIIDENDMNNLTDYIICNDETVNVKNTIEINQLSLSEGPHSLKIFAIDDENAFSNILMYGIVIIEGKPPSIEIESIEEKHNILGNDLLTLNCKVHNEGMSDKITVSLTINDLSEVIFTSNSKNEMYVFSHQITVPSGAGTIKYELQAIDKNDIKSSIIEGNYTKKDPEDYTATTSYQIGEGGIPLETKLISAIYKWFPEIESSTRKMNILLKYVEDNSDSQEMNSIQVDNEMTLESFKSSHAQNAISGIFEVLLNDQNTNEKIVAMKQPVLFYRPPEFELITPLQGKYYGNAFINVEILIKSNMNVQIRYKIDDDEYKNLTDILSVQNEMSTRNQIEIEKDSLSYERHSLNLFIIDQFGQETPYLTKWFYYYNLNTPTLILDPAEDPEYIYYLGDEIPLKGTLNDEDEEDNLSLWISFNDDPFEKIYECVSANRPSCHSFDKNVTGRGINGTNTITLNVQDSGKSTSKNAIRTFKFINTSRPNPNEETPDPDEGNSTTSGNETSGGEKTNPDQGNSTTSGGGNTNPDQGNSTTSGGGNTNPDQGNSTTSGGGNTNPDQGNSTTSGGGNTNPDQGNSTTSGGGNTNPGEGNKPVESKSDFPERTLPVPIPTKLPPDYDGETTETLIQTYTIVNTIDENGKETKTYQETLILYQIANQGQGSK